MTTYDAKQIIKVEDFRLAADAERIAREQPYSQDYWYTQGQQGALGWVLSILSRVTDVE